MYKVSADLLVASLGLAAPPVAVSFCDEAPAGIPSPETAVPAGCSFWESGMRGAVATRAADHDLCSIGIYTHNLADAPPAYGSELNAVLGVLDQLQYVRKEDIPGIAVLATRPRTVVYAPLPEATLPADVVLVFAHSRQSLVITEAVQQVDGGVPPALGRPACAVVPAAINSGRAALSLGCCGARAYLQTLSDDIALWAFPGAKIEAYAERIQTIAKANDTLLQFHKLRALDVAQGLHPTYAESLARMS
jgi:uncharacterized protein (DUF169 family)